MLVIVDLYVLRAWNTEAPDPGVSAALEGLERHEVKVAIVTHRGVGQSLLY